MCLFGMKFNTHVSHIYLRLNVEAFSSNRLDCRDKWRFHNVYKFPFSCSPSCHPFWRNFSVDIWSGENFWFAVNFKLCTCPHHFSFTYRCTFLFNKICIHDIPINISLIWKYLTRKDTFAILDTNIRPLNWKTIRKTTWKLSLLEFLVLKKLLPMYSKWQDKIFFRSLRDERLFFSSRPMTRKLILDGRLRLEIVNKIDA